MSHESIPGGTDSRTRGTWIGEIHMFGVDMIVHFYPSWVAEITILLLAKIISEYIIKIHFVFNNFPLLTISICSLNN